MADLFFNLGEHDLVSEPRSRDPSPTISDDMFIDDDDLLPQINTPTTNKRKRPSIEDSEDESENIQRRTRRENTIESTYNIPRNQNNDEFQANSEDPDSLPEDIFGPEKSTEECLDKDGQPIMVPVTDKDGNPKFLKDGKTPKMKKKKDEFNFNNRYIFLTYTRCNLTVEEFESLITEINNRFQRYFACREFHDDGTPHFHLLGDLGLNEKHNPPPYPAARRF